MLWVLLASGPALGAEPGADEWETVPFLAELRGQVVERGTKLPIAAAHVSSADAGTETDVEGRFVLPLSAGTHEVTVAAAGFLARIFHEAFAPNDRVEVIYRLEPSQSRPYETTVLAQRSEKARVTVSEAELRETAGTSGEPLRVVMLLPGVSAVASGVSYPVVRGSQPAATGYFVDGMRLPQLFHVLAGPSVIHPEFIDRIDFTAGVPSAQYGRLLGGAVEATVAKPREGRLRASASLDLFNASAFVEAPFSSTGTSLTAAGRFSYTALIAAPISKAVVPQASGGRPTPEPVANFYDYQVRAEQRISSGKVRLLALGNSDTVGTRSNDIDTPSGIVSNTFHRVDLRAQKNIGTGSGEWAVTFGPDEVGIFGELLGEKSFEYLSRRWLLSTRAAWNGKLDETWALAVGGDFERQWAHFSITGSTALEPGPADVFRAPDSYGSFAGLWAQATASFKKTRLVAGTRVDLFALDGITAIPTVEPRLEVSHALNDAWQLRGAAGLFHQAPTVLLNLPVTDIAGLSQGVQEAAHFEAGARFQLNDEWELVGTAFYQPMFRTVEYSLEQLLQARSQLGDSAERGVPGRSYGAELMIRKAVTGAWYGWLSLTLMRSERYARFYRFDSAGNVDAANPLQGWLPFAFEQRFVLNGTVSYRFPHDIRAGLTVHFNTGRPESGQISSRTYRQGVEPNTLALIWVPQDLDRVARLPPFFRVDARVSKTWTFNNFLLEIYLDIFNASVSREVLGYQYKREETQSAMFLRRLPFDIPLVIPQLGLKGTY